MMEVVGSVARGEVIGLHYHWCGRSLRDMADGEQGFIFF